MKKNNLFFFPELLTCCTLYRLTHDEPIFMGHTEEGNIAFYGLILQSRQHAGIQKYLVNSAKQGLWEYQHGYGVTAADSALVIEGLLERGTDLSYLKKSVRILTDTYYSKQTGAFKTVLEGRAKYWRGVSTETTAHIAYLLNRIDPTAYTEEIHCSARFVANAQNRDGFWTGKWFPSVMIPTYYAIRLLACQDGLYSNNISRVRDWIRSQQMPDGSWARSVIDTAAAILSLTLMELECPSPLLDKAKKWLLARQTQTGWIGEQVLYYWYEEDGEKLFFCCRDKGEITTAWATLALNALN